MKSKTVKRLVLNKITISSLNQDQLDQAKAGGGTTRLTYNHTFCSDEFACRAEPPINSYYYINCYPTIPFEIDK
ncbi:MAG: class I lanthipeptide [Candidatus Omnitrophota bacterium]